MKLMNDLIRKLDQEKIVFKDVYYSDCPDIEDHSLNINDRVYIQVPSDGRIELCVCHIMVDGHVHFYPITGNFDRIVRYLRACSV